MTTATKPTRRSIIGVLALAAPAVALATIPTAHAISISPELAEAFRRCRVAADAQSRFDPVETAARERYFAEVEALPHFTGTFPNMGGDVTTLTTAEPRTVALAKALSREVATGPGGHPRSFAERVAAKHDGYMRAARHVVAGAKWRDRETARIARATGLDAANAESNRLSDLYAEAETRVYQAPITTVIDLKAKLAFMVETAAFDLTGTSATLVSDVDRILAREA
jgi:hypothetical protein